jgi:hypothetical protein
VAEFSGGTKKQSEENECFIAREGNKINTDKFMASIYFHPRHHHAILFFTLAARIFSPLVSSRDLEILYIFLLIAFIVYERINSVIPFHNLHHDFFVKWIFFVLRDHIRQKIMKKKIILCEYIYCEMINHIGGVSCVF